MHGGILMRDWWTLAFVLFFLLYSYSNFRQGWTRGYEAGRQDNIANIKTDIASVQTRS